MTKADERKMLLDRFFSNDRRLYEVGKMAKIGWFDRFDRRFRKDTYAYFSREEKGQAIDALTNEDAPSEQEFIQALNEVGLPRSRYMEIDRFVGEHYYLDDREDSIFKLTDKSDRVREDVRGALKDTKGRAYYFLQAIISLHEDEKWDYGGATWSDILGKVREIGGDYPAARDIPIIKSYRIYYKTGSRRYPTHTIPEEMIPVVKCELKRRRDR